MSACCAMRHAPLCASCARCWAMSKGGSLPAVGAGNTEDFHPDMDLEGALACCAEVLACWHRRRCCAYCVVLLAELLAQARAATTVPPCIADLIHPTQHSAPRRHKRAAFGTILRNVWCVPDPLVPCPPLAPVAPLAAAARLPARSSVPLFLAHVHVRRKALAAHTARSRWPAATLLRCLPPRS